MEREKFKSAIEHNHVLRKLIPFARKTGMIHLLHMFDEVSREKNWTTEDMEKVEAFYAEHYEQFKKLEESLEDELSRTTLHQVMEYRKTKKMSALKGIVTWPQYFQKDIFGPVDDEVFVDGGAYNGDTVDSFIKNFMGGYI